ncbi:DedA family protein [Aestuariibius sp. HNIBRBA575]|uniref:DedA family protein n=1 Tax=Aestuariibius sp. HNIBRBA575 TaxID=3233343 RepID=UPI0034A5308C
MTDTLFSLVSSYGIWLVFTSAFLSCLFLPVPTSLIMLSAGAFVATGDLIGWQVFTAALSAAILGDQAGFQLGRAGGNFLENLTKNSPKRQKTLMRAQKFVDRNGAWGVFFSTWLFAPLGPWVNAIAGMTGLSWVRFSIADILGETIWVSVYIGLGYSFATRLSDIATLLSNSIGFLTTGAITLGLGFLLLKQLRRAQAGDDQNTDPDSP